jgi:DDE superfamily endonuclease
VDQLTPSLSGLLDLFSGCFRPEVAITFRFMAAAWIVCLGRRTISRVWETTGRSAEHSHYPAFRLFSEAAWNWDEVCRILLVKLLATFVLPGSRVWLVVDDTLCHKRGARVAFGGIYLDAVLSTKKHKVLRFGANYVTLGLIVGLPFRPDRFFCVNILWRVCSKKDKNNPGTHRTKPELAREMVEVVASWLPGRQLLVVGDSAYIGKPLLGGLPQDVAALGPIHWKAGLTEPLPEDYCGRRKKGDKLTSPNAAMEDDRWPWQDLVLEHPKGKKNLQIKVLGPCCWYNSAGQTLLQVVLVRDPDKKWRDEALLCSALDLSAQEVIAGYLKRWSVEVAYCDSKQLLGFHDPMVWSERSMERAHPMGWFVGSLVILWYALVGQHEPQAQRHRPWYKNKVVPTFADMLACCRLHLWRHWLDSEPLRAKEKLDWLLEYLATAA